MGNTRFAIITVISLLFACVAADPASREWKSLGNPHNRDLFFKFLKLYVNGRGMHTMGSGRKDKILNDVTRTDPMFDNFQQNMGANDIYDA